MKIKLIASILTISPKHWEEMTPVDFPFVNYKFLSALEQAGCLGDRTGWNPSYLTYWQDDDLKAALLLFSKDNSYGEYIFDFAWAEAYESFGLSYYPKYVSAVPFTPATGPKLLLSRTLDQQSRQKITQALIEAAKKLCLDSESSSVHALFLNKDELKDFQSEGFKVRHSFQYHWANDNFTSFADFLKKLRAKRRKEILRERRQAVGAEIKIVRLTGDEIRAEHAELMFRFYFDTVSKMGGYAYLTPEFFRLIFKTMKENILLVLALDKTGRAIAGALNFFGEATLYGRYWGSLEEYKFLHFELCYYQGIEFAIENRLTTFEAGAQGEHKFQRGFLPHLTYSAHLIQNPQFKKAIDDFIDVEKDQITSVFEYYQGRSPYSRTEINA